jgi:hypothetical protein
MNISQGIAGFSQLHRGEWTFNERKMLGDTHKAVLLNLGELSPCAHETEKVIQKGEWILSDTNPGYQTFIRKFHCECGKEVEPTGFVEKSK